MTAQENVHGAATAPDEGRTDDERHREQSESTGTGRPRAPGRRCGARWCGGRRRGAGAAARRGRRADRGDVPGWVLVTLMTAGLVTALWVIAGDALGGVFEDAINSVKAP